ncbi:zinc ABC transporter substrate-binding protein [Paracoccus caeni]|uniref:Zinc ABC transporter substrate-binding protein n=1 Tax=Paracoccus caeni TaxID=657651 RepID=A0A934SHE6_9RHOB|nr:zinc ABC transporter substrate-binding protein [Paracoccus caeni]MBK4217121.1 zinc ABC transporter substrate-binding protein [Paracoccus caeni]
MKLAIALMLLALPASAETVLTAHPATNALARALTKGSGIDIVAVQPDKLPASRLASYLHGRGQETVEAAAKDADAVLTLRSFWPDDPLYPAARRANIRIIEIDAAKPLDERLPGIALMDATDQDDALYAQLGLEPMPPAGEETAPWLSPTRLGEMAEIVAADLSRLAPEDAAQIAANLGALKHDLLAIKSQADSDLASLDSVEVVALSPQFGYFSADLGLDLRAQIIAAPREWTPERSQQITEWLQQNQIMTVLLARDMPDELIATLNEAGIRSLTMDTLPKDQPQDPISAGVAALTR